MSTPLQPNFAGIETASVVFAAMLIWLSAVIQHVSNVASRGAQYVMSDRSAPQDMTGFFGRATRTLSNNLESALMFVPLALLCMLTGHSNAVTHLASAIYIGARSVFSLSYWFKIRTIRSVSWAAGMVCCVVMAYCAAMAIT